MANNGVNDDPKSDFRIVSATTLSGGDLKAISQLIFQAATEHYELLGVTQNRVQEMIARQMGHLESELERVYAALYAGDVVGAYSALLGSNLATARMTTIRLFLDGLEDSEKFTFLDNLAEAGIKLPDIPDNSYYLSRISIAQQFQGTELAAILMEHFMSHSCNLPVLSLHVKSNNVRAIAFYRKHGFQPLGDESDGYLAFIKAKRGIWLPMILYIASKY